ncbi:hypothetical protein ES17_47 [Escherichia phage ES17]|uniref:Uncharacterized protein n=3 Tax=Kuravirus TaxID=680277 RepID=A0A2P1MX39_9CAUD|nr:hypothetical protein PQC45_gp047 [Escherichia phage ES17]AVP40134.1 hypothetical protein PSH2311_037 [Escherichia phage myPSH2311]AVQ10042.1 hypothetical protein PSH1131_037 [Escherichia phage myPSH1131]QPL11092.1 hypothetical protein ES17_47 [Escherichia phage ES17]
MSVRGYYQSWAIYSGGSTLVALNGQLCIFETENLAITKAAELVRKFPNKSFTVKRIEVPALVE